MQLFKLDIEVMLPLTLLVAAGAFWPLIFRDAPVAPLRTQLNRLVLYMFYPSILFSVAAITPITTDLLSVPLLVGVGSLLSGAILYPLLYHTRLGKGLKDSTRAILLLGGMFGNTFNIGVPVLTFFYGPDAPRYAVFNDMLMTMPVVWSLGVWISTRLGADDPNIPHESFWRAMLSMPPIWAFILGAGAQQLGWAYVPLVNATRMIGLATIPVILFVLGMTIPWGRLTPRREILAVAAIKLLATPLLVWVAAKLLFHPMGEAQYAAVVEGTTPTMVAALVLADRFHLDHSAAALLIGWSTIFFWVTLPLFVALGLIR
ncbi:MAG TPA: AEC family transporter [Burkholderiales bacterium]|nr:AEC family transporter [Burkholderiales bacterium]